MRGLEKNMSHKKSADITITDKFTVHILCFEVSVGPL